MPALLPAYGRPVSAITRPARTPAGPLGPSLCPDCTKVFRAAITRGIHFHRTPAAAAGLGAVASSPAVVTLANSIITTENANPSINNPGNLMYAGQAGATSGPGGLAVFPTYDAGLQALYNQIGLYASGTCGACGGQPLTIQQMANIYAPASVPGNNPVAYGQSMAASLGTTPDASLASVLAGTPVSSGPAITPDLSTIVDTSGDSSTILDSLSSTLQSAGDAFSNLDPVTMAAVALFGALALFSIVRAVEA